MKIRDSIEQIFGKNAFNHGLFYSYDYGLRFELSESGDPIEMFTTAYLKAIEVAQETFKNSSEIQICWTFYGKRNYLSSLSTFKEFFELGIKIPEAREIWSESEDDDDFFSSFYSFYRVQKVSKKCDLGSFGL